MMNQSNIMEGWTVKRNQPVETRLIAFYLPQFHPIPENDRWWGKGFTEWTNVSRARPLFKGHPQPHLPADLGFYDLRIPEVREEQAAMARQYGIHGFCYYHYWFNGKRLLERPFNDVLESGRPDLPFCLAWANESWSRRWLGEERDILLAQTYSSQDDLNHIRWLIKAFSDSRYIRVGERPLFSVYRPLDLPEPKKTTDVFRRECIRHGMPEPYLLGINAHCSSVDCRELGFDGTLDFAPQLSVLPDFMNDNMQFSKLIRNLQLGIISSQLKIYDYASALSSMMDRKKSFPVYPCIFVGWDNTPRRGKNGIILTNNDPEVFESVLSNVILSIRDKPYDERLIFINAWNEWAEGNHLEPDARNGHAHLEALKRSVVTMEDTLEYQGHSSNTQRGFC